MTVLTRKTFDEIVCPLEKKLDVGRNTVADRIFGLLKYGQLSLWIGSIWEAPGPAARLGDGQVLSPMFSCEDPVRLKP